MNEEQLLDEAAEQVRDFLDFAARGESEVVPFAIQPLEECFDVLQHHEELMRQTAIAMQMPARCFPPDTFSNFYGNDK